MVLEALEVDYQSLLQLSALILSIVNGLFLFWAYTRDRPKLVVKPIHPDTYQWYFPLPGGEHEGKKTRKYGFLTYISIVNKGRRDVALSSWRLFLKTRLGKWVELKAMSIPEPKVKLGGTGYGKVYSVLGARGVFHDGDTVVKSGCSIAGFAYYIVGLYGDELWNPEIVEGKAVGKIVVRGVYGRKTTAIIHFNRITLEKAKELVEGIDVVDSPDMALSFETEDKQSSP